jgi:hypothetical protein
MLVDSMSSPCGIAAVPCGVAAVTSRIQAAPFTLLKCGALWITSSQQLCLVFSGSVAVAVGSPLPLSLTGTCCPIHPRKLASSS